MIILASGSPRRRELLSGMGIEKFDIRPSAHEAPLRTDLDEARAVELIARGKAEDIAAKAGEDDTVIAAISRRTRWCSLTDMPWASPGTRGRP